MLHGQQSNAKSNLCVNKQNITLSQIDASLYSDPMDTLQHKVLDFEPPADDFDPNFIPEDGIQYLQQVVYERNKCPVVVVKPLNPSATASQTDPNAWHKFKTVSLSP